jgi:hypothetical protein
MISVDVVVTCIALVIIAGLFYNAWRVCSKFERNEKMYE